MMKKLFIDPHCHFFSARHVPLTHTLQRLQSKMVGSAGKKAFLGIKSATMIPLLLPILPFAGKIAEDILNRVGRYIQFFDTDAVFSIKQTIESLQVVKGIDIKDRTCIFTPLLMDFEMCLDYKLLVEQVNDIKENIQKKEAYLRENNYKLLPFLGLDLRRFKDCDPDSDNAVSDKLQEIINNLGISITKISSDHLDEVKNGDFIGIKLYPSLGCDLWPEDENIQKIHLALFKAIAKQDYPVTAHCQTGSYECGDLSMKDKDLANYGHPSKWLTILEKLGDDANKLRLNLAHFGGEKDVSDLFDWPEVKTNTYGQPQWQVLPEKGIRKGKSWTHPILTILKKYPHVYSDLAAFDFTDTKAASSLLWLLSRDEQGEFKSEGTYKLRNKLLWGSDVPMTLYDVDSYADQFSKFFHATNPENINTDFGNPKIADTGFTDHPTLVETLINVNPANFLFGTLMK